MTSNNSSSMELCRKRCNVWWRFSSNSSMYRGVPSPSVGSAQNYGRRGRVRSSPGVDTMPGPAANRAGRWSRKNGGPAAPVKPRAPPPTGIRSPRAAKGAAAIATGGRRNIGVPQGRHGRVEPEMGVDGTPKFLPQGVQRRAGLDPLGP
jgi:hypothetical protein